jgi:hypothetical protein
MSPIFSEDAPIRVRFNESGHPRPTRVTAVDYLVLPPRLLVSNPIGVFGTHRV